MLPLLVLLVLLGSSVVVGLRDGLRCQDAARIAARAAVRGEPIDVVRAAARAVAPADARVVVTRTGGGIAVTVSKMVGVLGPWSGIGPTVAVRGDAEAGAEPAVDSVG